MFGNGLPEMISLLIVFKVLKFLFCPPHGGKKRLLGCYCYTKLFLVRVCERHKPCDEECRYRAEEHEDEEVLVAELIAYVAAEHTRKHYAEVHDARSECVVCHLVLARRNLLHHEECKTYEAEAVAEVFENDSATDEPEAARLIDSEQGVGNERKVEHAAE